MLSASSTELHTQLARTCCRDGICLAGNGGGFENGVDVRVALAAKAFERMLQCVIATMDR